jgi:hypothetical protein
VTTWAAPRSRTSAPSSERLIHDRRGRFAAPVDDRPIIVVIALGALLLTVLLVAALVVMAR